MFCPGATPDEWAHFDLVLGLTGDLLPVVSNPAAAISANSRMRAVGKTPSVYNRGRTVVGIPDWTSRIATARDIGAWSTEPDYGICIQCREIRAIDVDLKVNSVADRVHAVVTRILGPLPMRSRPNSAKFLLAFRMPGEFSKRVLPVGDERIEFLATGQQFIAAGQHTSGQRYEWLPGLPSDFPEITPENFEKLWLALEQEFGTAPSTALRTRRQGETIVTDDDVARFLLEGAESFGEGKDGQIFMRCPFEAEHTGDTGETSTAYFPAGTNGYEQGHFVCLHAHCAGRPDVDFLDALGLRARDFDHLPAVVDAAEVEILPWPKFVRDKQSRIEATVDNMVKAVSRADICDREIRYDCFRDEIVWSRPGADAWVAFGDEQYVSLQVTLERRGFKKVPKETLRDVVYAVAKAHKFDTAQCWLDGLEWDGVPRVASFLETYLGAEPGKYAQAVGVYLWTALAGRVVEPGVKADMVPILVGLQGAGKSTAVSALAPDPQFFAEISFAEKEDDRSRKMRGCLVAEIAELRGLHTRDLESIKAFVTSTHEHWVPKFKEFTTVFPRRLVFIGTTNQQEFLADETGNRRWLPVKVGVVDVDGIKAVRDQLWAEGRALFDVAGVAWQDAERLGRGAHDLHRMADAWEEVVSRWLDEIDIAGVSPRARGFLQVADVMSGALGFDARNFKRGDEMRVAAILRVLGFEQGRLYVKGVQTRCWMPVVPTKTTARQP